MKLLIDTREQTPLVFPADPVLTGIRRETLPIGDYMVEFEDGTRPPIVWERKSVADLAATLTRGYTRFKAEWVRAQEAQVSLHVIIEAPLTAISRGAPYVHESGISLLRRCFTLMVRHQVPIIFFQNRREAARYIVEYAKAIGREYVARGIAR